MNIREIRILAKSKKTKEIHQCVGFNQLTGKIFIINKPERKIGLATTVMVLEEPIDDYVVFEKGTDNE